jgi:hypothetical protein
MEPTRKPKVINDNYSSHSTTIIFPDIPHHYYLLILFCINVVFSLNFLTPGGGGGPGGGAGPRGGHREVAPP